MSGFTQRRVSETEEHPDAIGSPMTWGAASAMLPLVSRIAADLVQHENRLAALSPEKARLDARRRQLDWAGRSRRYHLDQEIAAIEGELRQCRSELQSLGVSVLDPRTGLVGFPTIVNDRRAFFSWQPGEAALACWNYAGDSDRQPVPESWTRPVRETRRGRSRSQR
jgi:hypothetical protein